MTIASETRVVVQACLAGDAGLVSLAVAGSSPQTLAAHIVPGLPTATIGGCNYATAPFRRETLVELIVRTQRLRWSRSAPFDARAWPPDQKDKQALRRKHKRADVTLECGPGWTDLLDATFDWLEEIASDREWAPSQIKEKFGTLSLYWFGDLPDLGGEIIEAAEHLSGHLCEHCGTPGQIGQCHGWWSTRCRDHREAHQS